MLSSDQFKEGGVQELAHVVEEYGKYVADMVYGPAGPGLDVDLASIEDLAVTLQGALLKGLCEQLTQLQGDRLPETLPCPTCGCECRVEYPDKQADGKSGSRVMHLRGGTFELGEPRCYCRQCRRSFFPSADGVAG